MKDTLPDRVRLGVFELDLRAGELRANERTIRLQQQPFQILRMLIERAGEIVTREEIQRTLWPNDTVVEFDHSINAAIKKLRQALGDSAESPQYVETVARRGYRLMKPAEKLARAAGSESDPRVADEAAGPPPPSDTKRQSEHKVLRYRLKEFIGGKPAEASPPVLSGTTSPSRSPWTGTLIGKKVSHYRVLEVIGVGGMGIVYKAEDLKLGRQVALKFLPEELAWEPAALQRFQREARTASSLDHPNICTIYEVEEYEEQPFIVMQLLHGETLHARLAAIAERHETLPREELLEIASAIAAGLQAAHEKGIIHRDIKPANIFLTKFAQVKILDFGLAKLASSAKDYGSDGVRFGTDGSLVPATETGITRFDATAGTAGYMSPEQVRGENLDERTDIFSFGLVLYQMATGQSAFPGDSVATVKEAIVSSEPTPPRELNPRIPPRLEAIINRALQKDREQRYQTVAELRSELQLVKSRPNARSRRWPHLLAIAAVVLLTVTAIGWVTLRKGETRTQTTERQLTANSLEDYIIASAISADGKYVAYLDQTGLYLRAVESGETHPVPLPAELRSRIVGLSWFPGGGKLVADVVGSDGWDMWVITVMGAAKPHLLYAHAGEPAFSPDGRTLAFATEKYGKMQREVWIGDIDGHSPWKLVEAGALEHVMGPAWSPDGRWIALLKRLDKPDGSRDSAIELFPAAGGVAKTLLQESGLSKSGETPQAVQSSTSQASRLQLGTEQTFIEGWCPDWTLVFSATDRSSGETARSSLWKIHVDPRTVEAKGEPRQVTAWSDSWPLSLTITSDGKRLAYLKMRSWLDVYLGELGADGASMKSPRRFTLDDRDSRAGVWSRDSQAIYLDSNRDGRWQIFRQGLNDSVAETVVADVHAVSGVTISADGKWFLYQESRGSSGEPSVPANSVWLMRRAVGGGSPEKLLEMPKGEGIRCSSNSKAAYACALSQYEGFELAFYALGPLRGKGKQLGKIQIPEPRRWVDWDLSPDGSQVALVAQDNYNSKIEVLRLADGAWREITVDPAAGRLQTVAWAADGKNFFLTVATPNSFNLLRVSSAGKAQPLLRDGRKQWLFGSLPSPDGKHLAFQAQTWDSNVWMLETSEAGGVKNQLSELQMPEGR